MGSPRCSRLTNFARLLLPCLWMAANGYNIFRFTLRIGRYPRNNQPLAMNHDRFYPKIDPFRLDRSKKLYNSLFRINLRIKFFPFKLVINGKPRCILFLKDDSRRSILFIKDARANIWRIKFGKNGSWCILFKKMIYWESILSIGNKC